MKMVQLIEENGEGHLLLHKVLHAIFLQNSLNYLTKIIFPNKMPFHLFEFVKNFAHQVRLSSRTKL